MHMKILKYIMDDNEVIDYQYIWDLICKPINQGGVLFANGINLLIFRNPDNDILNKIELICPSSNNSEEFLMKKETLMVYNKGNILNLQ